MIRLNQVNVSIFEKNQDKVLLQRCARLLRVPDDGFRKFKIVKRSIDARNRDDICYSYTVDVKLRDTFTGPNAETERQYINKLHGRNISQTEYIPVMIPEANSEIRKKRPVIVGAGPCGLFAALTLITSGLKPVILERGDKAEARKKKTELFFETGKLFTDTNIQFGEGGAGLFSDGKLNTSIKGRENYVRFVLETFVEFGAPNDILIDAKPHIGTDILEKVIINIRDFILENGGTYYFNTKFTGFETINGTISKVLCEGEVSEIETDTVILCQGHSARDTYEMLRDSGLVLEKKPFAMGIRIQHPQIMIDESLYGSDRLDEKRNILGPSPYKLVHECQNGRSVYSFCMCPGGFVINSSSEEGMLTVNGMSYSDRSSGNANSAIIVNVRTEDFPGDELSGIEYQRNLEKKAYDLCNGLIPYETFSEFDSFEKHPTASNAITPLFKGMSMPADVRSILPEFMQEAICEGIHAFAKQIKGFDMPEAIIAGIEARTSSPVRIIRNENYETSITGLFASGEGAGYAGGITSAAVDGIRTALSIIKD